LSTRAGADFWSARLAHLAALGRVDGIAIVLPGQHGLSTFVSHNIPQTGWEGPAGEALLRVVQTGATEQVQNGTLQLGDGRAAALPSGGRFGRGGTRNGSGQG